MSMIPPIPVACRQEGRYKAAVHTGHKYDMAGNIYQEGTVLRESEWSDNLITLTGFQRMLEANRQVRVRAVAGIGNTDPEESDTTLKIYRGFSSEFVSMTRTVNATPDVDGYVTVKFTFRFTFNPGSLGSGVINVAEAGMVEYVTTPTAMSPVLSRGLLVDNAGNPTTVSYDATNEYLDMYWEFTHYIPAEVTGTVSITVDGVPTNYNYVCRPMMKLN